MYCVKAWKKPSHQCTRAFWPTLGKFGDWHRFTPHLRPARQSGAGAGQWGNGYLPAAAGVLRRHGGNSLNRQNRFAECVGSRRGAALRSAATTAAEVAIDNQKRWLLLLHYQEFQNEIQHKNSEIWENGIKSV